MFTYDLSILVPGVRNAFWADLFNQTCKACKRHSFEMIFTSPFALPEYLQPNERVKYIKTFGSPTRALHLASLIADGKFMTWLSDDGWVMEDSIDLALDTLFANNPDKDIISMRYSEGENHTGMPPPDDYWTAGYHDSLRKPSINPMWRTAPVMLLNAAYYRELGGLDCRFEHINMNVHDFAFRAQKNGSKIHFSPTLVMNCDFTPNRTAETSNVIAAYYDNDQPLFDQIYADDKRPIKIEENWRQSDPTWKRADYPRTI